jgi:transposase
MIVGMRADSEFCTVGTKHDYFCANCGARVMLAATTQRLLKGHAGAQIVCTACMASILPHLPEGTQGELAASPEEIAREISGAIRNPYRTRN